MTGDLGLRLLQRRAKIAHAQLSHLPEQQHDARAGFIGEILNSCNAMIFIKFNEALKLCCLKNSINTYGKAYIYNHSRPFVSPNQLIDLLQK